MPSEKTQAIVLRVVDFSETSCIVTLFTRDFGKIGALAKGARRPKSPFESALDVLAVCRIVFLHKSSDSLDLLTEAKLERRFRAAQKNLAGLYAGYYVAELLRELTDTGDPHPELYAAADTTLQQIDRDGPVGALVLRFELNALRVLGHLPALGACAACGRGVEATRNGRVPFGIRAGGVLCPLCRPGQRHVISVTRGALEALRQLADVSTGWETATTVDTAVGGELRGVLNQYLVNLLGHQMRMPEYLTYT